MLSITPGDVDPAQHPRAFADVMNSFGRPRPERIRIGSSKRIAFVSPAAETGLHHVEARGRRSSARWKTSPSMADRFGNAQIGIGEVVDVHPTSPSAVAAKTASLADHGKQ